MSGDNSLGKFFQADDDVPPIIWPLMKEILQQLQKGGEVTIVFSSTDQPSAREINVISQQLRDIGIKLVVNPAQNKPFPE